VIFGCAVVGIVYTMLIDSGTISVLSKGFDFAGGNNIRYKVCVCVCVSVCVCIHVYVCTCVC